jgi:cell wall-associated NlpC family hydrolase
MRLDRLFPAAVGLIALALAACSSAPKQPDAEVGARAARHALEMQGTPYRPGGNTARGFDCSGLVQYSYAQVNKRLPRNTEGLWSSSRAISRSDIRPGDLLFFHQEGKRNSHVAIYVGNGRFVHAPSSGKRVSTASLNDRYWSRHFSAARRPQA